MLQRIQVIGGGGGGLKNYPIRHGSVDFFME